MPADLCFALSHEAQERLLALEEFKRARTLALYSPIHNEVFTEEIFAVARGAGKRVFYPRVRELALDFVEVADRRHLAHGQFGILEPRGDTVFGVSELDLLILPGVAFDQIGHRLGYGKGFYDRALHQAAGSCTLIGLCYEFQRVSALPFEAHDVCMDLVVTEGGSYLSQQSRLGPG